MTSNRSGPFATATFALLLALSGAPAFAMVVSERTGGSIIDDGTGCGCIQPCIPMTLERAG